MRPWAVLVCLSMAACGILGPTMDAYDRRPLQDLPEQYRAWYVEVASCIGQARDFDAVLWFVAEELYLGDDEKGGVYSPPNEITLRADHVLSKRVVKHELIHYIRQEIGHGPIYDRCTA